LILKEALKERATHKFHDKTAQKQQHRGARVRASRSTDGETMTASDALPAVLEHIDRGLDGSVERLFALLRIQSISTDPAYAKDCRAAADHVAAELRGLGLDVSVRATGGHPVVIAANNPGAKHNGANGKAPRVLFYGHYDVQPVDPLSLWDTPPFEPRIETLDDGRKAIVARGACDDKGQAMTFVEACRAFKAVTGATAA
jgi:acetylornithine deacetylase/succinyl-diaminopimelate desuccinylase-like protein